MTNQNLFQGSRSNLADQVAGIWDDVLGSPAAATGTTFFELGGQSIAAMRIVARIEEEIGVTIDLGDLFNDPDRDSFIREVVARAVAQTTERSA